jgi:hypothetical protein
MRHGNVHRDQARFYRFARGSAAAAVAGMCLAIGLSLAGCKATPPPKVDEPRWPTLPLASVPNFMHGTILERVRFTNTDPMPIYGYGLVVNLHGTGDSTCPTWLRQYISKQIELHGFGTLQEGQYAELGPEEILNDKRVAIVIVEAELPVGAREGQRTDVIVRALPESYTTSLAHGELYEVPLSEHGLQDPSSSGANPLAVVAGGPIFVNPAYALTEGGQDNSEAKGSLRVGTVLNSAEIRYDRPINLQLRQPQASTARFIEAVVQRRFHGVSISDPGADRTQVVAAAQDEGLVELYVPWSYNGDWKHFLGVVSHLYLNDSPAFTVAKAKQLVEEAHKPGAQLADISLCWEAMGDGAMPIFEPLISDPDPAIQFAAARAAAFLGDAPAREALMQIAMDSNSSFQLDAVRTLADLPDTPEVRHTMRALIDGDKAEVRVEAYRYLADNGSEGVISHKIGDSFYLDIVPSSGPPMVYATSTGIPRLAVFGTNLTLETPVTFTAMNDQFSISSTDGTDLLTLFYRDPHRHDPVDVQSRNDLAEILARLGGQHRGEEDTLDFSFNDVVAMAQQLVQQNMVYSAQAGGTHLAAVFQLQHPALDADRWTRIPTDTDAGRPQGFVHRPAEATPAVPKTAADAETHAGGL